MADSLLQARARIAVFGGDLARRLVSLVAKHRPAADLCPIFDHTGGISRNFRYRPARKPAAAAGSGR